MKRRSYRSYEPAEVEFPKTVAERTVNAACLNASVGAHGDSVYLDHEPSGLSVRVSNHARHRHHVASYTMTSSDVEVLILTPEQAINLESADRFTHRPDAVVIRNAGERYATTAKHLRSAIARALWAQRT